MGMKERGQKQKKKVVKLSKSPGEEDASWVMHKRQTNVRTRRAHATPTFWPFWNATLEQQSNELPPPSLRAFAFLGDPSVCRPTMTGRPLLVQK